MLKGVKVRVKFEQIASQYRNFIINITGLLTVSLIFSSGIGRYRVVLVYAVYYLLKALSALLKDEQRIFLLFFPATVIALFFDVTKGPIFPLFAKNYLVIALPVMMVVDTFVVNSVKKMISNITEGQFFIVCPSCNYGYKDLVEKCLNCSYKKGNQQTMSAAKIAPSVKGDKMSPWLLNLLSIGVGEKILFHKKLNLFTQQLKNGERVARKHFVITTANVIILDYYSFHIRMPKSWRERDVILLSDIVAVEGKMKQFYMTMRPFLIIRTINNDVYEIILSTFFGKYVAEIKEIAALIKEANPQVEIVMNLSQPA
jgi:hypothetical protein